MSASLSRLHANIPRQLAFRTWVPADFGAHGDFGHDPSGYGGVTVCHRIAGGTK